MKRKKAQNQAKKMKKENLSEIKLKRIPEPQPKKRKIQYRKILWVLFAFLIICLIAVYILQMPIGSILIKGNTVLSDQEIIDLAGLRNYPSALKNSSTKIEQKLAECDFIQSATVSRKNFYKTVVITVEENRPLFYYQANNKVILQDGTAVEGDFILPTVLNQIPEDVYQKFLQKMGDVPEDVLIRISEIRYYPNDVDSELFFLSMNDGNYVYVNIEKFDRLYNYLKYVEGFDKKRGILHLDSGDYLDVLEEN